MIVKTDRSFTALIINIGIHCSPEVTSDPTPFTSKVKGSGFGMIKVLPRILTPESNLNDMT